MLEKEINSMRYSTPIRYLKYLQYHWVASNSKGHGIHSPFVFQIIKDILNAKTTLTEIEKTAPAVKKILDKIEAAGSGALAPKIKIVIARLLQWLNPLTVLVTGDQQQFEDETAKHTNVTYESVEKIDFAFIGEGQDEATMLQRASSLIDKMHSNSLVILHGIHTDSNMQAAWIQLKQHATIRLTIDLFDIGLLFCRTAQKEQEHFIIRY
jgi:hypothetical protein